MRLKAWALVLVLVLVGAGIVYGASTLQTSPDLLYSKGAAVPTPYTDVPPITWRITEAAWESDVDLRITSVKIYVQAQEDGVLASGDLFCFGTSGHPHKGRVPLWPGGTPGWVTFDFSWYEAGKGWPVPSINGNVRCGLRVEFITATETVRWFHGSVDPWNDDYRWATTGDFYGTEEEGTIYGDDSPPPDDPPGGGPSTPPITPGGGNRTVTPDQFCKDNPEDPACIRRAPSTPGPGLVLVLAVVVVLVLLRPSKDRTR